MVTEIDACEYCGVNKKEHGTSVDLELFYQDYTFAGYPAFCSWEHTAAWFAQPPPDFRRWDKSPDHITVGDRVFGVVFFGVLIAIAGLAVFGLITLIRAF